MSQTAGEIKWLIHSKVIRFLHQRIHKAIAVLWQVIHQSCRQIYKLPPSSAEVKNAWNFTSTLLHAFMAWYFIKHSDNFTFFQNIYILKEKKICCLVKCPMAKTWTCSLLQITSSVIYISTAQ
jgi:hypothetical protein